MVLNAAIRLVYFAMVSDGPTTLGLRPENENLHLEECSEWVHFPCFLHTKNTTPSRGYFPNHFPYFRMQESTGRATSGGGSSIGGGGVVLHHKGGRGRWVYGLGNDVP